MPTSPAVKPSPGEPERLRHDAVTRPFPKSVFFPSQVELVCSSEAAWRGTSRRSGAAICARLGTRVIGSLQQKIGGSNSRGLQWSGTDTYFFVLLGSMDHFLARAVRWPGSNASHLALRVTCGVMLPRPRAKAVSHAKLPTRATFTKSPSHPPLSPLFCWQSGRI